MKKILFSLFALAILISSFSAQAAQWPFPQTLYMQPGGSGDFNNSSPPEGDAFSGPHKYTWHGNAYGQLAPQSKIIFTYSLSEPLSSTSFFTAFGNLSYKDTAGNQHEYMSHEGSPTSPWINAPQSNYYRFTDNSGTFPKTTTTELGLNAMLVQAQADASNHTITITNLSHYAANYHSLLLDTMNGASPVTNVHYQVSAVPLPAALPLFGLAVAGFAGYNRRKKKAA